MNYLKLSKPVAIYLVFILLLLSSATYAQDSESPTLMFMRKFDVKPGHDQAFKAGIVAWKKCYNENNGDKRWSAWKRQNGQNTSYTMSRWLKNWAEMDEASNVDTQKCASLSINLISPHIESQTINYVKLMSETSRNFPEDTRVIYVGYFKVKDGKLFEEIVKSVESSVKAKEGQARGIWYSSMGGAVDTPDYFVAVPMKNFAALDMDSDSVWKVHAAAHGQKKSDEMRENFRNNLVSNWSHIYSLTEEISN